MDETMQRETLGQYKGFDWTDYVVFMAMVMASIAIGIYFGCFGSKQKSPLDYLLGGKKMNPIPVGLSMVASTISANTLIGLPSEVYTENIMFIWSIVTNCISCVICYYFFIPIFYELNLSAPYEYLEFRFNKNIRTMASLLYCISYILFLPVVIYLPSMTLSLVTGVDVFILTTCVTIVCVFYTMIGGLKAVIWTDLFQIISAFFASVLITIIGTMDGGGVTTILKTAYDGGKFNIFDMDPDPFKRSSFLSFFGGGLISNICGFTVSQACCQRYLSLKSSKSLPAVFIVFNIGFGLIWVFSLYGGVLLYSVYYGCDPIENKVISKTDQIFPLYIVDRINVPVLPGLFVAGVFGAALSSLSTGLNTITGVVYEDYLKTRINTKKASLVMRLTTVIIGVISACLVYFVGGLGKMISASTIITSVTYVPIFVVFMLGMLIPNCNTKGATAGMLSTAIFLAWIGSGNFLSSVNLTTDPVYPEDVNTCPINNQTQFFSNTTESVVGDPAYVFPLYKLSFMLYNACGSAVGLFFGIITTYLTGPSNAADLNPILIAPPLRRFLPKKIEKDPIELEKLYIEKIKMES